MSSYTQVRGWLNISSIKAHPIEEIRLNLKKVQEKFVNDKTLVDSTGDLLERKNLCYDTIIHKGGNDSVFIFFGTERNYCDDTAFQWIKFLIKYFPSAEGRIDFQNENDNMYEECKSRYLLIRDGEIIKDDYTETWCEGYGNRYKGGNINE